MLVARTNGKSFVLDATGALYCNGSCVKLDYIASHFEVVASPYSKTAFKLRSVAYPQYQLAILNSYLSGQVSNCGVTGRKRTLLG